VFPDTRFTLAESVGKKARFVESVVNELRLSNVTVAQERAEALAVAEKPEVITARAVAPLDKLLDLFSNSLTTGTRLLLYKGPDVEAEIRGVESPSHAINIVKRYELPEQMGARTVVEVRTTARPPQAPAAARPFRR
jgi:16S rRNA (guanine527-N7)-methyltransferase